MIWPTNHSNALTNLHTTIISCNHAKVHITEIEKYLASSFDGGLRPNSLSCQPSSPSNPRGDLPLTMVEQPKLC